jgi:hypothetical protein
MRQESVELVLSRVKTSMQRNTHVPGHFKMLHRQGKNLETTRNKRGLQRVLRLASQVVDLDLQLVLFCLCPREIDGSCHCGAKT